MNMTPFFEHLIAGKNLTKADMRLIMQACMKGELTDAQLAAFLALMRAKGENGCELTAAAEVMMEQAHTVNLGAGLIDLVGTGGDGKNTFNVSTASAIVAAAAGARVAKHGNRSVSGKSGSADVLAAAGIELNLSDKQLQTCLQENNICFLFAPHFHQAMQKARNARQQLGVRTFFNLLGPLLNPARVSRQVVGVFDARWQQTLAEVLVNLGSERAIIISSQDGMDEISIAAPTDVLEYYNGRYSSWRINPEEHGLQHANLDAIVVDSPAQSLALIESVLQGEPGPARDIVLLNSAIALYCAGVCESYTIGLKKAAVAIDKGLARLCFERLKESIK